MRSSVVCSHASGSASRWLRGTPCRVAMPMQPRSLHDAACKLVPTRHLRLVVTHASSGRSRSSSSPNPRLNELALERFNKPYDQLDATEKSWCITKNASAARWQGHQAKPKAEDDEEMQRIAQETFGKPYQDLSVSQKRICAGKKGNARMQAAHPIVSKEKPVDAVLQAIAQEKYGKDLADLTHDEQRACISAKAGRTRWEGHEPKPKPSDNQDLQSWAQELYGKPYDMLSTSEKKTCAGKMGAMQRNSAPGFLIDYSAIPLEEAQELLAQEKFGKPYAELDRLERKAVSNTKSSRIAKMKERKAQMPGNP